MASSGDGASGVAAVSATAASGQNDTGDKVVQVLHSRVGPEDCPHDRWIVCGQSIIGRRKKQEDRMIMSPSLGGPNKMLVGVFDGTVGSEASDFVHRYFVETLLHLPSYQKFLDMEGSGKVAAAVKAQAVAQASGKAGAGGGGGGGGSASAADLDAVKAQLAEVLTQAFLQTDEQLLEYCRRQYINYSASTGVVCLVAAETLTCGHVGDSRAALGRIGGDGKLVCNFLTRDHKPNQTEELRRIERSGGSLTYLHGGKPFIRGGDFTERQRMGDRPMQLNYSRAFGGKDLKMYGLSCQPDILQVAVDESFSCLVLASDGLWDTCSAELAVVEAHNAYRRGVSPADHLVQLGLQMLDAQGSVDNITAVVVLFKPGGGGAASVTTASAAAGGGGAKGGQ